MARNIDRFNDEFDEWLPDDRDVSGMLVKHGHITGLDDIKYERTLELTPSITVSETGNRSGQPLVFAGGLEQGFTRLGPFVNFFPFAGADDEGSSDVPLRLDAAGAWRQE